MSGTLQRLEPEPRTGAVRSERGGVVVAGLGNEYRRDDGVGPMVAAQVASRAAVRDIGPIVDPLDLLGRWDGADVVLVVDAVDSSSPAGTVQVVELPARIARQGSASTHGISLAGVLALARTIGRAPRRVVVVGIEGADFGRGTGLTAEVSAAVPVAVGKIVEMVEELGRCV